MGLLSDRQIMARCMRPNHFMRRDGYWEPIIPGVTHTPEIVANMEKRRWMGLETPKDDEDCSRFGWRPMIHPFSPVANRFNEKGTKIISWGTSSYGYDIRIKADGIKLFTNLTGQIVDPMRPYVDQLADPMIHFDDEFGLHYFVLPPNTLALAHTVEYFVIPRDLLVTCLGKSTYARVGLSQLVTPLEPEWEGELVLEIASMTNSPTRVYLDCGIAQLLFHTVSEVCRVSYKDKGGKYQGQRGTTLART